MVVPIGGDEHSKMVNCVPETEYSGKFYAVRDIEEGEEILTDYDVNYTKWSGGSGGGEEESIEILLHKYLSL